MSKIATKLIIAAAQNSKKGTLWVWGSNSSGQLGNNDPNWAYQQSPVQIGANTWSSVEGGTIAIRSDSTLWAWGYNASGQLGDSTIINKSSPVQIGTNLWKTGDGIWNGSTFAIRSDNTLWVWGLNNFGQLGDGTIVSKSSPVQIGTSSWKAVAGSISYIAAIRSDGTLWAWGYNLYGQLGQNNLANYSSPVQIGTSSWKAVVTNGYYQTYAIRSDNTLWAWGLNSGILGTNDAINYSSPVQIGTSSWLSIASLYHGGLAAIRSDNTLWTWGNNGNANAYGVLGQNNTTNYNSPVQVGTSLWTAVAGGSYGNCAAIRSDGTIWAWGSNVYTQLNIGLTPTYTTVGGSNVAYSPLQVGTSSWLLGVNGTHSLAIRSDNTLWAWGNNSTGQLGQGDVVLRSSPTQIGTSSWKALATNGAANGYSLAIRSDNTLWVWGNGANGQLGQNSIVSYSSPVQIGTSSWTAVGGSNNNSVALRSDGTIWAWGLNSVGQLGDGTIVNRSSPVQIGTSSWLILATSGVGSHTAAIRSGNTLWVWGLNSSGQLGDGTIVNRSSPVQIGTSSWTAVGVGNSHTVAIRSDGTLWVWGGNTYGQLGTVNQVSYSSPVQIGTSSWKTVAVNSNMTYAIRSDNTLWYMGNNYYGQAGVNAGPTAIVYSPIQIGTGSWLSVACGNSYVTAIRSDNTIWAWGQNLYGNIGTNIAVYSTYIYPVILYAVICKASYEFLTGILFAEVPFA